MSEVRLIHDCSPLHSRAVNEHISADLFRFQTFDNAIKLLQPNYYMEEIDLHHAYYSVPIHPANHQATGCKWQFSGNDHFTYSYHTRLLCDGKSMHHGKARIYRNSLFQSLFGNWRYTGIMQHYIMIASFGRMF